jgi:hypothetical protein
MRKSWSRWWILGALAAVVVVGAPLLFWALLSYQPHFYRELVARRPERSRQQARHFVAQSLQLRNDIMNEPRWEAAFSDQQVNAWLAEDLVTHFADQIPPGVRDPRVIFEADRVILAFKLEEGPFPSVITVMVRLQVPEENVLALTLEKIQAGMLPVPADKLLERITAHALAHGLDVRWEHDGTFPVAMIHYQVHHRRRDIVLEHLDVRNGHIRLSGRSGRRTGSAAMISLPTKRELQMTFPRRKVQPPKDPSEPPLS